MSGFHPQPARAALDHEVEIVRDVIYGHGLVHCGRPEGPIRRELKLDLYLPVSQTRAGALRPALILAFGGAFHRGSKENDAFEAEGGNTAVAQYCLRFARRGYVACAIDYRLVTEDPDPGTTPVVLLPERIPTSRVDVVRRFMNLPPATPDMLWRGIEAASDDMAAATRFVRERAADWGVDPARIAVGGFSAGARTALNTAFGEKVPVAAVVALSGFMDETDLQRHVLPCREGGPAVLIVSAENDLDYVVGATPGLVTHLRSAGLHCEHARVPRAGHFYAAEASAIHDSDGITTVEQAMARFLGQVLAFPAQAPVAESFLQAFADAWNRHDLDALMRFMTEDCVFEASFGPDACGTRYEGITAVREGFSRAWRDHPDAQWRNARHFVAGDRGVSEWTFTGTRASDGTKIETNGCDLFTFHQGRIRVKNSWRKIQG